ncbi:TetR/AcrR family transcriptional regulator [Rhodococcoides yunnanense]|uniref:TetR/AcrR family transcriptional regulator n=1 Tax=Rhodococcoides yunnanense TaxID=278209 RepID=UPI000932E995|nr:TetR/AcrR family transcriptional regulator [Rhodococcus yunnanensis]
MDSFTEPTRSANRQPQTARGRSSRNALIRAAREVFEEQNFHEARIADIPARAGMSYGTFYTYFDSKEEIFREVVSTVTSEVFNAARSGLSRDATPVERIRDATARYLDAYQRSARLMHEIEQISPRNEYLRELRLEVRSPFLRRIEAGIDRWKEEGVAAADLDSKIAASALGGMIEFFARQWFLFGERYDKATALDTLTTLWARGIGIEMAVQRNTPVPLSPETSDDSVSFVDQPPERSNTRD